MSVKFFYASLRPRALRRTIRFGAVAFVFDRFRPKWRIWCNAPHAHVVVNVHRLTILWWKRKSRRP